MGEEEQQGTSWGLVLFSLPFLVIGGLVIAQALGLGQFVGKALVPSWVLGIAGSVFFFGGVAFLARAFGVGDGAGAWLGYVIFLGLGAILHYTTFGADLEGWSGHSILGLSAGEVVRLLVVTFDLFLLLCVIDWLLGKARGIESPLIERVEAMKAGDQKVFAGFIVGAPLLLAIVLHATGVLDRIGAAMQKSQSRQHPATQAQPASLLESYAGWWETPQFNTPGEVSRFIIRTEGRKAWIRMWELCAPNHCEIGEKPAKVGRLDDGRISLTVEWKEPGGLRRKFNVHALVGGDAVPQSLGYIETRNDRTGGSAAKRVK